MVEKIINIKVKVEVGEDFNIQDLAVCKYVDDNGEVFIPKDSDFKVIEYLEIIELQEYIYGLFENGEQIDQTSLDELNENLAWEIMVTDEKRKNNSNLKVQLIGSYALKE